MCYTELIVNSASFTRLVYWWRNKILNQKSDGISQEDRFKTIKRVFLMFIRWCVGEKTMTGSSSTQCVPQRRAIFSWLLNVEKLRVNYIIGVANIPKLLHSRTPHLDYLRSFCVIDHAYISPEWRRKLDTTSIKVGFLDCTEDRVEYIVHNMETDEVEEWNQMIWNSVKRIKTWKKN